MAGTLGSLVVEIGADIARLRADMGKSVEVVHEAMGKIKEQVEFVEKALHRLGEAATIAGIYELTRSALEAADAVGKISIKVGITTDELQSLSVAAKLAGVSNDQLATGLKLLDKNIAAAAAGAGTQSKIFKALGIDLRSIGTGAGATQKVLEQFADAVVALKDAPALAVASSLALLGRSGTDLLPALQGGGAELRKFAELAKDLDLVLSEGTIKSATAFNDSMTTLGLVVTGMGNRLLTEVAGPLQLVGKVMEDAAIQAAKMNKASLDLARPELINWGDTLARTMAFVGDTLTNVAKIFAILVTAIPAGVQVIGKSLGALAADWTNALSFGNRSKAAQEARDSLFEDVAKVTQGIRDQIKDLVEGPTLGQALEKALSTPNTLGDGSEAADKVKKFTDAMRKQLEAALASGGNTGGKTIAEQQTDYLQGLLRSAAVEQELTKEAEVRFDIEKGKARLFDETTKKAAIQAAIDIDTAKGTLDAQRLLTGEVEKRAKLEQEAAQKQREQIKAIQDQVRTPVEIYRDTIIQLNQLGGAATLGIETYTRAVKAAQDQLSSTSADAKALNDAATQLGFTFTSAFEDAVANGKKLQDVLAGLLQDIAKIILRLTVTQPIGNALSEWLSPGSTGQKTGSVGSGGGGFAQFGDAASKGWDWLKGLFGFQYGGSFTVGGAGGPDSQLVAFKATPGEQVTVGNGGGGQTVNFQITTNDARGFDELLMKRRGMITAMVQNAFEKNAKRGIRR